MAKRKPGKYDEVIKGLPALPPDGTTEYQGRVEEEKKRFVAAEGKPVELAALYAKARIVKELLEADVSKINLRIAALEGMLSASREAGGPGWGEYGVAENAIRLPNGDTVRVQKEPYGKVMDKEAFRLWCVANGYEKQLQLWPSTMNSLVKERLLEGQPEPDGCTAFSLTKVVYAPAKEGE